MLGSVRVVTQPIVEPVSPEEIRTYVRQYDASLDGVIGILLPACRALAEAYTNRAAMTQTIEYSLDALPLSWIRLPRPPFVSLTSITFYDEDGAATVLTTSDFDVATQGHVSIRLKPSKSWPSATARDRACLVIRYVVGCASSVEVPYEMKLGILTAIAANIDDPGNATLNETAMAILDSVREVPV